MPTITLTDRKIAGLKATGAQTDYFDRSFPGFGVRVSQQGRKSFILIYRNAERKVRRLTLGIYGQQPPALTLATAREQARLELQKISIGRDPGAEQRIAKAQTVEALAAAYLERHAKPRKRTWRYDQTMINRDILPAWKGRPAVSITRRDCRELVDTIAARSTAGRGTYANRVAAIISRMFQWGMDHDWLPANPAARLPKPGVEANQRPEGEKESKPYDADELRLIWARTETLPPAPKALYRVQLLTGARPGEVSGMAWAELDGEWWTIPAARSKNGRAHRLYLVPEARELLAAIPRLKARVFIGCLSTKERGDLNRIVFEGIRRRNKPRHALRDTAATNMAKAGVRVEDISRVLNHVTGSRMTAIYNMYEFDREKRLALLKWARTLTAILEQTNETVVVPFTRS